MSQPTDLRQSLSRFTPGFFILIPALFLAIAFGGHLEVGQRPLAPGATLLAPFDFEGPTLLRAVVGVLVLGALAYTWLRSRLVQLPHWHITGCATLLVVAIVAASGYAPAQYVALREGLAWVVALGVFFLICATAGRRMGPRLLAGTVLAAITWVAMRGILEYGSARLIDPTHRIFAGYNNPNAAASVFIIGLILGLGLVIDSKRTARIAALAATVLCGLALLLTQSRGGFLAAGVGVFGFAVVMVAGRQFRQLAVPMVVVALIGALGLAVSAANTGSNEAATLSRVGGVAETQVQSVGFRVLLWRTAGDLIQQNPAGYGAHNFQFVSGSTGRIPPTFNVHQAFLQAGVDGGILALLMLPLLGILWLFAMGKRLRLMPEKTLALRAGLVGSVLAVGANGLTESNLGFFAVLMAFFALLGIGLQLAADGSGHEPFPKQLRLASAGIACILPALALCVISSVELRKRHAEYILASMVDPSSGVTLEDVQLAADRLRWAGGFDGEALGYVARLDPSLTELERASLLYDAASLTPSPRAFRLAASVAPTHEDRLIIINRALDFDPNNLTTLWQKLETFREMGDLPNARAIAEQIIGVEGLPYFQVRAIPEIVPTETYDARVFLAETAEDAADRVELYLAALQGYLSFTRVTFPSVIRMTDVDPSFSFGGVTRNQALDVVSQAKHVASRLVESAAITENSEAIQFAREAEVELEEIVAEATAPSGATGSGSR